MQVTFGLESKPKFKLEIKPLQFRVFQWKCSRDMNMNRHQPYDVKPPTIGLDANADIHEQKLSLETADPRSTRKTSWYRSPS